MHSQRRSKGTFAVCALLLSTLGLVPQAFAQTGTVTGRVTTDGGQPLPAAQVSITALSLGVLGQQNGSFTIQNVPAGTHTLTAQRIGYRAQTQDITVTAGGTTTVSFILPQEALALDALVVTGTPGGTQRRAIGNLVEQVSAAAVTDIVPVADMQELLTGRTPGLQFNEVGGSVGTGSAIRVRGVGSLTLGSQPLIYVDGIRVNNATDGGPELGGGSAVSALDDINPQDIESIEIIKGPAAATLYGTEASEGVIQIITKRGAQGAPQFDFSVNQGVRWMSDQEAKIGTLYGCRTDPTPPCPLSDIFEYNPLTEANNLIAKIHETGTSGVYPGGPFEWDYWPCETLFCKGHQQTYNLSVRGGSDAVRYFVSGEFLKDEGVVYWNTNDRKNVRANLSLLLAENLTTDISLGYIDGFTRFAQPATGEGDLYDELQWSNGYCIQTVNPCDGRLAHFNDHIPSEIAGVESTRDYSRFIGSMTAQYTIGDWLTQRLIFGVDNGWDTNQNYYPLDPVNAGYPDGNTGRIRFERPIDSNVTLDYAVSANTRLNESLAFTTSGGLQYYSKVTETFLNDGRGFGLPVQRTPADVRELSGDEYDFIENKSVGAYIQEEINWNERVFLTAAVRFDDNSAFGGDFDAQYYPKVSLAWVTSEEPFWNVDFINTLRLRGALGQAGRSPETFDSRTVWESYPGAGGAATVRPSSPGNPAIGPEVSTELELGFDVAMLDDRVSGAFTWYNQKTEDALVDVELPSSTGLSGDFASNLGRIDNWGYEATIDALLYQSDNVTVDLALAGDYTNNEIKDLGTYPGTTSIQVGYPFPNVINYFNVVSVGPPDEFGEPTDVMCDLGVTLDGSPADPDANPQVGVFPGGDIVPCDQAAGLRPLAGRSYYTNTFSVSPTVTLFQNFRLFAVAQGMYGKVGYESQVGWGLRYNNGYCTQALELDPSNCSYWLAANRDAPYRDDWSQWMFDADFWKLRELGLQYEVPESLVARTGASRASFTVAVRDLWTLWRKQDTIADPDGDGPLLGRHIPDSEYQDLYRLPPLANVSATLRVSF